MQIRALVLFFVVGLATTALGETLRVPGDHATIQAAVDAAQDEDVVLVAAGNHAPFTVNGKDTITVRGRPGAVVTGTGGAPAAEVTNCGLVLLDRLTLVAGPTALDAVHVAGVSIAVVQRCVVRGGVEFGAGVDLARVARSELSGRGVSMLSASPGSAGPGLLQVQRCEIYEAYYGVFTDEEHGLAVTDTDFSFIEVSAITVGRATEWEAGEPSVAIERCTFEYIGDPDARLGSGISVTDAPSVLIRESRLQDIALEGIHIGASVRNARIEKTRIARAGDWAVKSGFGTGETSVDNRCVITRCRMEQALGGISMKGRGYLEVDRTTIRDVETAAVRTDPNGRELDEATIVLRRTKVDGAGGDGFALYGSDCVIDRCRLTGIRSTPLWVRGDGGTVRKLRVTGGGGYGVDVSGDGTTFERNVLTEVVSGVRIFGGNSVILRNKFTGGAGVQCGSGGSVSRAEEVTVSRNVIRRTRHGLEVTSIGGLVEANRITDTDRTGLRCSGERTWYIRNRVRGSGRTGIDADTAAFVFERNIATGNARCDYEEHSLPEESTNEFSGNNFPVKCFDD